MFSKFTSLTVFLLYLRVFCLKFYLTHESDLWPTTTQCRPENERYNKGIRCCFDLPDRVNCTSHTNQGYCFDSYPAEIDAVLQTNYSYSKYICESNGFRLCTYSEYKSLCVNTGCWTNYRQAWTSTECIPYYKTIKSYNNYELCKSGILGVSAIRCCKLDFGECYAYKYQTSKVCYNTFYGNIAVNNISIFDAVTMCENDNRTICTVSVSRQNDSGVSCHSKGCAVNEYYQWTNQMCNYTTLTLNPSNVPTNYPTYTPSLNPSNEPSLHPSNVPSIYPTNYPSKTPSNKPSLYPSQTPSIHPSNEPFKYPSYVPSITPSHTPSKYPLETLLHLQTQSPTKDIEITDSNDNNKNQKNIPKTTDIILYLTLILVCVLIILTLIFLCCFTSRMKRVKSKLSFSIKSMKQNRNSLNKPVTELHKISEISKVTTNSKMGEEDIEEIEQNNMSRLKLSEGDEFSLAIEAETITPNDGVTPMGYENNGLIENSTEIPEFEKDLMSQNVVNNLLMDDIVFSVNTENGKN